MSLVIKIAYLTFLKSKLSYQNLCISATIEDISIIYMYKNISTRYVLHFKKDGKNETSTNTKKRDKAKILQLLMFTINKKNMSLFTCIK